MFSQFWTVTEWDQLHLFITRLVLVVLMAAILFLIGKNVSKRVAWKYIPLYTKTWSLFWITYLFGFSTYIWMTGNFIEDEWFRALYGTGFAGTIWGLFWFVWYGTKDGVCSKVPCQYHEAFVHLVQDRMKNKEDVSKRFAERTGGGSK